MYAATIPKPSSAFNTMTGVYVINRDGTIQVPSQPVTQVQGQVVRVNDSGSVVQCSKAKLAKLFE